MGIEKNKLNIIAQINDLETINVVGISICSEFAIRELISSDQVISHPLDAANFRHFSLHYMTSKKHLPVIRNFIEYVQNTVM